jgi:hypothetical protein
MLYLRIAMILTYLFKKNTRMKCTYWVFAICLLLAGYSLGYTQQGTQPAPFKLREGAHNFSLQWIGWEKPGKVQISKKTDSSFTIQGEQKGGEDGADFVSIRGTLKVISPRELLFDGTILTKVKYIFDGKVCDRTGTYHFLAKGTRKYWRLQEMDNCAGASSAVDYVDIFF